MSNNFEVWEEPKESDLEKDCLFCVYEEDPERKVEPYEYPCSECKGFDKFERYDPHKNKQQMLTLDLSGKKKNERRCGVMRNKDILLEIEDVSVFYQYLYLSPEHHIIVNNGLTDLKYELTDSLKIMQTNMNYPQFGASNQPLDLTNILGIIDKLKNAPPNQYPDTFNNRWQEIKETTMCNLALNLIRERR